MIMNQQFALVAKKVSKILAVLDRILKTEGSDPSHHFSTVQAVFGVSYPILISPVKERHCHAGKYHEVSII